MKEVLKWPSFESHDAKIQREAPDATVSNQFHDLNTLKSLSINCYSMTCFSHREIDCTAHPHAQIW